MGLGPIFGLGFDLSTINIGAIRGASQEHGQASMSLQGLVDQYTSVQGQTAESWQGSAGSAFNVHAETLAQAKRQLVPVLQQQSSLLNTYADQLQAAQQRWNSGKSLLNGLPRQLQSQVLAGGGLSVAGLGIADPIMEAALLGQAVKALGEMVGAQIEAQAAGDQLAGGLKGLQGLIDEVQSLLSGNQSHAQPAGVTPADPPPLGPEIALGLGGGLGVLPMTWEPPDSGIIADPIPEPRPGIISDPIPEPRPGIISDPIPPTGPAIAITIVPPTLPGQKPGLFHNKPGGNKGGGQRAPRPGGGQGRGGSGTAGQGPKAPGRPGFPPGSKPPEGSETPPGTKPQPPTGAPPREPTAPGGKPPIVIGQGPDGQPVAIGPDGRPVGPNTGTPGVGTPPPQISPGERELSPGDKAKLYLGTFVQVIHNLPPSG